MDEKPISSPSDLNVCSFSQTGDSDGDTSDFDGPRKMTAAGLLLSDECHIWLHYLALSERNSMPTAWRPGTERMIQIAVLNESTSILDADIRAMLPALSHQWNVDLQPLSGVGIV